MAQRRNERDEDRNFIERGTDEVRSWFGDEGAERRRERDERDENRYDRDPRPLRTERESASWGTDAVRRGRDERSAGAGPLDRGSRTDAERSGEGAGYRSPDRRVLRDYGNELGGQYNVPGSYEEDFFDRRYSYGPTGHLYGQSTGHGVSVERYTGGWESTIPGPHAGKGPRGYKRNDERIREDVNERLTRHGEIDPSDVEVAVENGIVTLSGSVSDRQTKYRIEDVVEDVPGVTDVINRIRTTRNEPAPRPSR